VTVRVAVRVAPAALALIVKGVEVVTALVEIGNAAFIAPCGTIRLAWTVAAAVLLLESVTAIPPDGAGPVSVSDPWAVPPPTTFAGLTETAESEAGAMGVGVCVKAPGVKRLTADQAPAVPAELMPRTRHQCWRPALSVDEVNWDGVTTRSTTSGAEKLFESSIWIR
jgi:hypothetical protein